jgi:hypothetical protein
VNFPLHFKAKPKSNFGTNFNVQEELAVEEETAEMVEVT